MKHRTIERRSSDRLQQLAIVTTLAFAVFSLLPASALAQKAYPSAEAAADAFTAALSSGKPETMNEVLGDDFRRFIPTEDIDQENVDAYLAAWEKQHMVVPDPFDPESGRMVIAVGPGDWTFPIPIVKSDAGWRFDVIEGAEVMKTRRIGRNELAAISASLAYGDAQRDYAAKDRNGNGQKEYAQRIISTPGEMDGLYWAQLEDDEEDSPLGPFFGNDEPEGSYHGYHYRIVKSQGESATGGASNYVVDGAMTGGFALVAWPEKYDDSGIMTFIVNQDAVVYQTDLGADTDRRARELESFDPRPAQWTRVDPREAR
jgi:hypothetical protein